jgi:hypothetical protein
MCWLCNTPESSKGDYLHMVREKITTHGYVIQSVEAGGPYPPFSYTAGRTAHGAPELVMTGLHHSVAQPLLDAVVAHPSSSALTHGDHLTVAGWKLEVVMLSAPTAHLAIAVALYGQRITALQLVHADDHGAWPWSLDYSAAYRQPVLGPRTVETADTEAAPQRDKP